MRTYLAGPMRGYVDHNFPAFHAAAAKLRAEGHEVFNPAENDEKIILRGEAFTLRRALGDDLAWICSEADAIALLPGWENSKGAMAEYRTALALGLKIIVIDDPIPALVGEMGRPGL